MLRKHSILDLIQQSSSRVSAALPVILPVWVLLLLLLAILLAALGASGMWLSVLPWVSLWWRIRSGSHVLLSYSHVIWVWVVVLAAATWVVGMVAAA